ncbi:quinolinate synthetase complex, A subunit [Corynebacterium efficiens YS-314]|uniref:Quinolinate synthase n=1 Tax=Corynebacterium efficiens (strain DSM 44549 / YS-314 / AJ 12310 / JCM 11189 / NBRC 100395) TaxID=196164 RepID=Q8FQK3_COREF|nr:quinolinate synthase NadA [Corynebacterium efficiens]EEW50111.1 quinolinate synthetase complex, A subunit [Corynebacterium efficiens YS-314]BAC17926.1 putative quinolinate synthetase [Corynebacterium efficiens YS-314]
MTTSHPAVTDPSVDHALQLIVTGESTGSSCAPELADGPWLLDAPTVAPGYGPGASQADPLPLATPRQQVLPETYRTATETELHERIRAAKETLGEKVVILGHFYQRDEVVQHADFVGDSFQLARAAKGRPEAEAIVFCGVHFMAETADLLSTDEQAVILPNLAAGCSMADMADLDSVEDCWEQLEEIYGTDPDDQGRAPVIPVTYMNSSAALKGFVGRHGGIVCTSSNAAAVLEWAFERGQRVLFFPDQHLGRNTAKAMGIPLEQMPLWNPNRALGGNTREELEDAKVLLWHGFCSVHKRFTVEQIDKARREYPDVHVVVHPESPMPVVDAADSSGSTDFIVKAIQAAPAGSTFAIGTEINLVQRLAAQYPQHTIFCLDPVICPCSTMYRIHPSYLAWVLEELVDGRVVNQISVSSDVADPARVALERMLAVVPTQSAAQSAVTQGATK